MSIKIHHGPPGSYKTAGAVADDFIRAAKEGRVCITNVRGMSFERFSAALDDLPDSFDLIFLDTSTAEGKEKMQEWFMWAPPGAFLHIDEAQDIFPKRWRPADLLRFDFPGGPDAAKEADRPENWEMAWDMHRHWNWDIVLTTPNIKKIRDDIRGAAEGAFKHKNLGLLGIGGRYIEGFHAAEDDGKYDKDFISVSSPKKIPSVVWSLYDSTKTGVVTDTKAGLSILKNPRIALLLFVLACCAAFIFRNGTPKSPFDVSGSPPGAAEASAPVPGQGPGVPGGQNSSGAPVPVSNSAAPKASPDVKAPFDDSEIYIKAGFQKVGGAYTYVFSIDGSEATSSDVRQSGYYVRPIAFCLAELSYRGKNRFVKCTPPPARPVGQSFADGFKS